MENNTNNTTFIDMMLPYVKGDNRVNFFGGFDNEFAVAYVALADKSLSLPESILLHCATHSIPHIRNCAIKHPNATDAVKMLAKLHG